MPIGTGIIYNVGDLILSQVSGSGTAFLETKIAAATSSIVYFDNTARINSASLNSITVGTASYVSGSTSIITNLTASNISASGTGSFGMVGIGTTAPGALLDVNGLFRFQQDIRVNNGTDKLILSATSTTTELHSAGTTGTIFKGAGNNEIVRFDATNFNVGIGTTTVSRKLHVYVDTGPVMRLQSSGSNASIEFIPSIGHNRYNWLIGAQQNISDAFEITPSTATNGTTFSTPAVLVTATGNVGIGTTSPTAKLVVMGDDVQNYTKSSVPTAIIADDDVEFLIGSTDNFDGEEITLRLGTVHSTYYTYGAYVKAIQGSGVDYYKLAFGTSNGVVATTKMTIDNVGNIGIGTTVPGALLEVSSSTAASLLNVKGAGGNGILFVSGSGNVGIGTTSPVYPLEVSSTAILSIAYQRTGVSAKKWGFDSDNSNTYWVNLTDSVRSFILSNTGNVGIGVGVGNPAYTLDVSGDLRISGSGSTVGTFKSSASSCFISLIDSSGDNVFLGNDDGDFLIQTPTSAYSTKLIVKDDGNVGIGTTSPAAKLQVAGNISGSSFTSSISNAVGFLGTSSWAQNVVSASYALTSSFATTAQTANALNTGNSYTISGLTNNSTLSQQGTLSMGSGYQILATTGTAPIPGISFVGDTNTGIYAPSADTLGFSISGSERVRIASDGNVGIGTTSPGGKLDIVTSGANLTTYDYGWDLKLNTAGSWARSHRIYNTNYTAGTSFFGVLGGGSSVSYAYWTYGNPASIDATGYNTSNGIFLIPSGNVGIGTTSPSGKLEVRTNAASNYVFTGTSTSGYTTTFTMDDTAGYFGHDSAVRSLILRTNSTARLTITGDGNVGIGTTAPAAKLEISGSSNSVLLNIKSAISGAILFVSGSGAVGINTSTVGAYTLQVNGSFAAETKSFVIEHPTKAGKKLIYGSLESPYHGIRLTGRDTLVNGKCKIQLPDYIYKLILHDSVNIQLTGIKCNKTLYVDEINIPENYFTIAYDKAIFESYKDYDFFWDFTGIRTDVPELITEL